MTELSVLLLGVGLGIRHATDADHVVVVSALVQREPSVWRAARIAALWGAGHTAAFLGLGLLIVLAKLRLPPAFEEGAQLLVGTMLVAFGLWHLAQNLKSAERTPSNSTFGNTARPLAIGLIHGLAGSAGIALLAATTIASRTVAVAYLGLVALGTVIGMVALTVVMSRPIGWAMRREGRMKHLVGSLAALLSVAMGLMVLVRGLVG